MFNILVGGMTRIVSSASFFFLMEERPVIHSGLDPFPIFSVYWNILISSFNLLSSPYWVHIRVLMSNNHNYKSYQLILSIESLEYKETGAKMARWLARHHLFGQGMTVNKDRTKTKRCY